MKTYTFDPTGVHLMRLRYEAEQLGGDAVQVTRDHPNGTPGAAMLEVTVPESVTLSQVEDALTAATGVDDEGFTAFLSVANIAEAKDLIDALAAQARLDRAIVNRTVVELNILRAWVMSFKAAVAAATSLSNLQTRVAALDNLNPRTKQQVITAIKTDVDAQE